MFGWRIFEVNGIQLTRQFTLLPLVRNRIYRIKLKFNKSIAKQSSIWTGPTQELLAPGGFKLRPREEHSSRSQDLTKIAIA